MKDGRLEVSDLMTGDWVDANGHKEIVEQIERSVLTTNDWAYDWKESVIKPIPLTKEILEKIGFKYNQGKYGNSYTLGAFFLIEPTVIAPKMMDEYKGAYLLYIGNDWIVIKYLHELQHALKLCKIEQKIEL